VTSRLEYSLIDLASYNQQKHSCATDHLVEALNALRKQFVTTDQKETTLHASAKPNDSQPKMSLPEVYRLAHTAECRLQMAANAKERDLRFVVGHLMHYESLRLRIVEIEHDISKSARARAVQFQGTGELKKQPTPSRLGRRSPSPPPSSSLLPDDGHIPGLDDDEEENELSDSASDDQDADDDDLGLTRFPSGSARPPPLEPDEGDEVDEYADEPVSPEEPDQASIEQAMKGESNELLAAYYNRTRKCSCHGKTDAESFDRVWELPAGEGDRQGVTRVVAEVSVKA